MTYNQLGFAFTGLKTIEFAAIEAAHDKPKNASSQLVSGLSFGIDIDDHAITCTAHFKFEKKQDQPFLLLKVQGQFEIDKEAFENKVTQEDGSFLIIKDLATHFAVLTVGSARGILHAKTEGTVFNQYLLPTIDVKQMILEDIIFRS